MSDGNVWVWRMQRERYLPDCIVPTVRSGGGGISVWSCFSGFGLSPLLPIKSNLNASSCQDTSHNAMLPTLWTKFGEGMIVSQLSWKHRNLNSLHYNQPQTSIPMIQGLQTIWPTRTCDLALLNSNWRQVSDFCLCPDHYYV